MKVLKFCLAVLAVVLLGSACYAQSTPFLAAGSSAAFNAFSLAGTASVSAPASTNGGTSVSVSGGVASFTCSGDCDVTTTGSYTIGVSSGSLSACLAAGNPYTPTAIPTATQFKVATTCTSTQLAPSGAHFTITSATVTGGAPLCTNTPNGTLGNGGTATNVWVWTQKSSHTYITGLDSRGTIPAATAKAWVEWATGTGLSTDPPTSICVYLAVDSVVGNRLFFATNSSSTPAGTISCSNSSYPIPTDSQLDSGSAKIFPAEYSLPQAVCTAINGLPWNAAPSDIRAEDAVMQMGRVCATYTTTGTGYGYGCTAALGGISSTTITSAFSATGILPVDFTISGTDPITSKTLAHSAAGVDKLAFKEFDVAGQALLILANTTDSSGLGATGFTSINHVAVTNAFTGHADYVSDICDPTVCTDAAPLTTLVREPMSGTYTTFEFQGPRANETSTLSQEDLGLATGTTYIMPNVADASCATYAPKYTGTTNPFACQQTTSGALKARVYGTGEMINVLAENGKDAQCTVNSCATVGTTPIFTVTNNDLLGYAFYSFGNVAPLSGDGKYLFVDGVDPIGFGGTLPNGCSTPPCTTNFTNINNGSYRFWNVLRTSTSGELGYVVSGSTPGSFVCGPSATVCMMMNAVQSEITFIQDLTPLSDLTVFRSHYTATLPGHNGFKAGAPESGGDVKGAVLSQQSELDFIGDFNAEQLNELQ